MSTQKTCLGCAICYFESGSPGYSEMTPGSPMILRCSEGKWDADEEVKSTLKSKIDMAETCREYIAEES